MEFIILGGVLLLMPVLLMALLTGPTLHTEEIQYKGFGDAWSRRETLAFWLLFLWAATRGLVLLLPFSAGVLLMTYGVTHLGKVPLPYTVVSEVLAFLGSLLLWWWYHHWRASQQTTSQAPVITSSSAPPALQLNTPYVADQLTVTIHSWRTRRPFRPIPPPAGAAGQVPPITWFIEVDCTLKNLASKEALIWAQLEEVLPEQAESPVPLRLRQFIPLSDDETADRGAASTFALSHAKYSVKVKETLEYKFFFKLDEAIPIHTMAFSLHTSRKDQVPSQRPLFVVEL